MKGWMALVQIYVNIKKINGEIQVGILCTEIWQASAQNEGFDKGEIWTNRRKNKDLVWP